MKVYPRSLTYELLLTAQTAISHHDPAVQDDSNRMLFNRQKQLLPGLRPGPLVGWSEIELMLEHHRLPLEVAPVMVDLTFPEFVATAMVRLWLDIYNSGDGSGIFEGMARYERLEARLRHAAIASASLRQLWDRLCATLNVPIPPQKYDAAIAEFWTLPAGTQQQVLRVLSLDYRSIVQLARYWHTKAKATDAGYAERAGIEALPDVFVLAELSDAKKEPPPIYEAPGVSANSVRHELVRQPAWLHLADRLGLDADSPGKGPVPEGIESMFDDGGNIAAGAKQPSNVHRLANTIRETYPSLDLIGGVTDTFVLGEGQLQLASYLVCRENREALGMAADLPLADVSVFDMLDDVTLTHQAASKELGKMIFSFETLAAGAQILCRFTIKPQTNILTHGALLTAIDWWQQHDGTICGQSARGFGVCDSQWLMQPDGFEGDPAQEYEDYIELNKTSLVAGLMDGTLGCDRVVCMA